MSIEAIDIKTRAAVYAALGDPARLAIVDRLRLADASPAELSALVGAASNLLAHHLRILATAGVITRTRSEGDRRRAYVRLKPDVLADLHLPPRVTAPRVVFVCTRNTSRSPLAAALWQRHSPVPAASAGTDPAARVHPKAMAVARRHGLRLTSAKPAHVSEVLDKDDLVIAVCDTAHETLTNHPRRLHWSVPDPVAADTDAAFDAAFAELDDRVTRMAKLLTDNGRDHR
ncbi:helix-turn-helix domain-containing protein [Stackebrandtia nassauensis]|uniref:Transcriptional regulator, ArsR family n=1 Tax=Stackebrandtia nassauensis (strain DSM 44728 / CIP 108903 / NRRL B-16338 / NBRC 102104 / LLR-40K-21) TaxID=446470 RepID=D3Q8B2_STANL|nr:helix-turn-helix domain-containing protein [Stackebrandtia nassauensis]ADD42486.1 transcriptional regulator, ArsR family [Stackebrandtia nassauensis DSM 44728]